uniref:C2 domain-containing protein n=1 Tax=Leersia perrieri TaxID=77586 RepID=A0A0D9XXJ2_9ORYZ
MASYFHVVDVISADVPPSNSYYVRLRFNGQTRRTSIKENVALWNERFCFDMRENEDASSELTLEAANKDHVNGRLLLKLFIVAGTDKIILQSNKGRDRGLNDIYNFMLENKDQYDEDNSVEQPPPPVVLWRPDAVPTKINPDFEPGRVIEKMRYLFVRVIKARMLPDMDANGSLDPYVEVKFGPRNKGLTRHLVRNKNPEWNETFAFPFRNKNMPSVDVVVNDKDLVKDDFVGMVQFDLKDIPYRSPDDVPLEPSWYPLLGLDRRKLAKAKLLLAIWIGSQADEAFRHVWEPSYRPKMYDNPNLWCLRVTIVEARHVTVGNKEDDEDEDEASSFTYSDNDTDPDIDNDDIDKDDIDIYREVFCKARLGYQIQKTGAAKEQVMTNAGSTIYDWRWQEDIVFVAAEPFFECELKLIVIIASRGKDDIIGKLTVPLSSIVKRGESGHFDTVPGKWYDLKSPAALQLDGFMDNGNDSSIGTRIYLQTFLDGGYNIVSGSEGYIDDTRPADKTLWSLPIGRVHLGILRITGLPDGSTMNPYCVAKYGDMWVRSRIIVDCSEYVFNEQHTWSVYDIATVLTVGIFDYCPQNNGMHDEIGKVRIHLSSLETDRIYAHSYPLIVANPDGIMKAGELQLAVKLTSESPINMLRMYAQPTLPKMHYTHPLTVMDQDKLRHQAARVMALRLGRVEPPLRSEVVAYMCNAEGGYNRWSMRKSKANFYRLMQVAAPFITLLDGLRTVRSWKNPGVTLLAHVVFLLCLWLHELLPRMVLLCVALKALWNYRFRPTRPPYVDDHLSLLSSVLQDELNEEFDTVESTHWDLVRMRYDRLRSLGSMVQASLGDVASAVEKIHLLVTWRDPRATAIFQLLTVMAALLVYVVPIKVLVGVAGFYIMRHPRFRRKTPPIANFFSRLPSRHGSLL